MLRERERVGNLYYNLTENMLYKHECLRSFILPFLTDVFILGTIPTTLALLTKLVDLNIGYTSIKGE